MNSLVDFVCDGILEVIHCLLEFVGDFFDHMLNMGTCPVSRFLDLVYQVVQSLKYLLLSCSFFCFVVVNGPLR